MPLSHRAARTHLVAPRDPKYFLRRHNAGSVLPGSGRPVRHIRLRPGGSPQTLRTPPHGGRPILRARCRGHRGQGGRRDDDQQVTRAHPGSFLRRRPVPVTMAHRLSPRLVSLCTSHARRGITPAFGYGPRLENGPAGLPPARNMRRPAHTMAPSDSLSAAWAFPGAPVITSFALGPRRARAE